MNWKPHMRRILARLGEEATLVPASGAPPVIVTGVFAAPYAVMLDGVALPGIAGSKPRFSVMTAELGPAEAGDTLSRGGVDYIIGVPEIDEPSGITVLPLSIKE